MLIFKFQISNTIKDSKLPADKLFTNNDDWYHTTTTSTISIDVFINDGSNDYYLIKNAPIVSGGSLELIDGGSKIVMLNNDVLKAKSDTASSLDVWASFVDAIST